MKILIAPDSFKGSLRAGKVADAISKGILSKNPDAIIEKVPLADGGEGTLEAILSSNSEDLQIISGKYSGPLSAETEAFFLFNKKEKIALIEMAQTAGLELLKPEERNPLIATTMGVGQQIKQAIEVGAKKIILFVGGSATNDAGIGMASELGWVFRDEYGDFVEPFAENLEKINHLSPPEINILEGIEVKIATDVTNPFYGENGAAKVFGKQKGAFEYEIKLLDDGLKNFAKIVEIEFGLNLQNIPGSGSAGGLAGGGMVFLNGKIVSGTGLIFNYCNLEEKIKNADWVISGEGKIDSQTFVGKLVSAVLNLCKKHNKKVILVAGKADANISELKNENIVHLYQLTENYTPEYAIENAEELLEVIGEKIAISMV
ncbi:MAG: glycerate kinase [Cytophagaceae bacterium]|nr:glycerate kinase [Cytophagaceae bacterium]